MNRVVNIIKNAKSHADKLGLGKSGWLLVLVDSLLSKLWYGFSHQDYFVISNGYAQCPLTKKKDIFL